MSDPNDESQSLPVVEEELKIPSEAEHKKLILKLWIACVGTAGGVFLIFGGIVLTLFIKGYDSKKVVEVSTAVFQVLSMTAGVGFFIPLGLTSIVTLLLGLRMSRRSINVLDRLDGAVEDRLKRVDGLLLTAEKMVEASEQGKMPPAFKKLFDDAKAFVSAELGSLKAEIKGARTSVETDLTSTLDQAEREANAPDCPRCGQKMIYTPAGEGTEEGYICTCVPAELEADPAQQGKPELEAGTQGTPL